MLRATFDSRDHGSIIEGELAESSMFKPNFEEMEKRWKAVEKYFYKEVVPVDITFEEWAYDYEIFIYCFSGDIQDYVFLEEINEIYKGGL